MNEIMIGSAPYDEDCAQVGSEGFRERAQREAEAFKFMLQDIWPDGKFRIKWEEHDFGRYPVVVARYPDSNPDLVVDSYADHLCNIAFEAEANAPANWNDKALRYIAGDDNAFEQEQAFMIHFLVLLRVLGCLLHGKKYVGQHGCMVPATGNVPSAIMVWYFYANDDDPFPEWMNTVKYVTTEYVMEEE